MSQEPVALIITDPDAEQPRYVEVHGAPFTLGNAPHADVRLPSTRSRVRVRFLKTAEGWAAQNLALGRPGEPAPSIRLRNHARLRTGGVTIEFFDGPIGPDTRNRRYLSRIRSLTREVISLDGPDGRNGDPSSPTPVASPAPDGAEHTAKPPIVSRVARRDDNTAERPKLEINSLRARHKALAAPTPAELIEARAKAGASERACGSTAEAIARARDLVRRLARMRSELDTAPWAAVGTRRGDDSVSVPR